jgi:hypothetical protein
MRPSFNIAGPCIPGEHYMLPPERRLGRILELVEDRRIFALHDGRQTGKTTSAMWLADHLDATGRWRAVCVDLETAREKPDTDGGARRLRSPEHESPHGIPATKDRQGATDYFAK